MSIRSRSLLVLAALVGAVGISSPPSAQESDADFHFLFAGRRDYTTVDLPGGSVTSGSLHGIMTVTVDRGGAPLAPEESVHGGCAVFIVVALESETDFRADCDFHSPDEDHLYMVARLDMGDTEVVGGGEGIWQFIGGTGRFEDARAECEYTVRYLEDDDLLIFGRCDN